MRSYWCLTDVASTERVKRCHPRGLPWLINSHGLHNYTYSMLTIHLHLHQYLSPQTVVWARRRRRSLGMVLSCITNRFLLESQHRLWCCSDSHGLPPVHLTLISQISTYRTPSLRSSVADREHRESAQVSFPMPGGTIARSIRAEALLAEKDNEMLRKRKLPQV